MLLLLFLEITEPHQNSEIATSAARFNVNVATLAEWNPDEVWPTSGNPGAAR
jgi:hypothetical protein